MAKNDKIGKNPPLPWLDASGWVRQQHGINFWNSTVSRYDLQSTYNRGDVFRQHGLQAPNRIKRAGQIMRSGAPKGAGKYGTEERAAAVAEWQDQRPGGGSPSGASHEQWVAWGKANPNRASNAARAMGSVRGKDRADW
jgi:hypothetical protein